MKIIKIAENPFEDEGFSSDENTQAQELQDAELSLHNEEKRSQDMEIGKVGPTYTSDVLRKATEQFTQITSSFVASGSVAWIKYNGIIYEIKVSPAALGDYFSHFKNLLKPNTATPPENIEDDNIPM